MRAFGAAARGVGAGVVFATRRLAAERVALARAGRFADFLAVFRDTALARAFGRTTLVTFRRRDAAGRAARLAVFAAALRPVLRTVFRARADLFAVLRVAAALRAAVRGVLDLAMSRPFAYPPLALAKAGPNVD